MLIREFTPTLTVCAVVAMVVLLLCLVSPWFRKQVDVSVRPVPEAFTEVYFSGDPPSDIYALDGRHQGHASFSIQNDENREMAYPYSVSFLDEDGGVVGSQEGTIDVAAGDTAIVEAFVDLRTGGPWKAVSVIFQGRAERLEYLRSGD